MSDQACAEHCLRCRTPASRDSLQTSPANVDLRELCRSVTFIGQTGETGIQTPYSYTICSTSKLVALWIFKQNYVSDFSVSPFNSAQSKIMDEPREDILLHAPTGNFILSARVESLRKTYLSLRTSGTGKTLCYVLPVLSQLSNTPSGVSEKKLHAIICVPTRELAVQVRRRLLKNYVK